MGVHENRGEVSPSLIIKAIDNSKRRPLARVIFALGIRHIGEEMAEILAKNFHSLNALANASRESLMSIPTVGPKIADSIITFFRQKENKDIINITNEICQGLVLFFFQKI